MLYKNLTTKELYASIPATDIISKFFEIGLEVGSTQLAVSAMEELMVRGDTDIIASKLQSASDKGLLQLRTSITGMIARSLAEYREDPILCRYGKALLKGEGSEGILEWMTTPGAAKMFNNEHRAPQEVSQAEKVKDGRKTICADSTKEWIKEAINESFQPG